MSNKEKSGAPQANIFTTFGINPKEAEEGKWLPMGGNVRVKLRRFGSMYSFDKRKQAEAEHLTEDVKDTSDPEGYTLDARLKVVNQHLAEGILVDWENVIGEDGKEIPFSTESALSLVSDERLIDFREALISMSLAADNYRYENAERAEKN